MRRLINECAIRRGRHFRQEHGHATVPVDYPLNPKLGWWVTSTRQQRKKGKLTEIGRAHV